jgi:superoxide reductase
MAKQFEIYVCKVCGNTIEVLDASGGKLVCCGQPMELQTENTVDASKEKHIPVVTLNNNIAAVQVGSVPHPMEENHHISWIELRQGDKVQYAFLKPGQEPKATFTIEPGKEIAVREFCNLHGLWRS